MTPPHSFLPILRVARVDVLTLVLLTLAAVQFEQRLLCCRAERLMADMHAQTIWAQGATVDAELRRVGRLRRNLHIG